jgi:hypothetical protein
MKIKKLGITFLITASSLLATYASDNSPKTLQQALQGDKDAQERRKKSAKGRILQRKGEKINKTVEVGASPFKSAGAMAGKLAVAKGDMNGTMAAAAFSLAVSGVEGLGKTIGEIFMSVGRYQERSQEIRSATEALVEDATKSQEKIANLKKKQQALLNTDMQRGSVKAPESSESSSRLKRFGKSLSSVPTSIQNKVGQTIDVITNEKAQRGEQLKAIQAALRAENEHYAEIIKLLQIKLLEDIVKQIDRGIRVENTIKMLKQDIENIGGSLEESSNKKSKAKGQIEEIAEKEKKARDDLAYFMGIKDKKPGSPTLEELNKDKAVLVAELKKLTDLTKLGDLKYLQNTIGIKAEGPITWSTIAEIYRAIEPIRKEAVLNGINKLVANIEKTNETLTKMNDADANSIAKELQTTASEIENKGKMLQYLEVPAMLLIIDPLEKANQATSDLETLPADELKDFLEATIAMKDSLKQLYQSLEKAIDSNGAGIKTEFPDAPE